jgi:rhomboid family GlyGly-CTERM serine protease
LPLLLSETAISWLEYRREAIRAGEFWRLWSAHFVHYSVIHAVLDGLSCLTLVFVLSKMGDRSSLLLRLAVIAPAISLVMFFTLPDMAIYRGASALAMALTAVSGLTIWRARPGWRQVLVLLAIVLLLKVAADSLGVWPVSYSLPAGVRVAWQAHVAGIVCGLVVWRLAEIPGRALLR